ncbi:peptidoglycan-binding domain-containing protein [Streptomyces sp. URMC 123]|uniref:peptidoglycan-binding domain-containing protein n=1 Tax=Streptomyces sp. URMC 123 TaxID=3423403 RepID=UPI003F1C6E4B
MNAPRKRVALVAAAASLGTGLALGPAAVASAGTAAGGPGTGAAVSAADGRGASAAAYRCTGQASQYKWKKMADGSMGWTAGFSRTMTAIVGAGSEGAAVAEAQCLLKGYRCDPGAVDGDYGPDTKRAIVRYQQRNGLNADGVVGKNTWKKLRKSSYHCN